MNYLVSEDQFEGHDVTKFYNCNKCGKSYSRRPNLVKHQEKCNFSQQQIRSTSLCKWYERSENGVIICQLNGCQNTGKSFLEALFLASTNPQYDKRLFIDLPVEYIKTTSSEHVVHINCAFVLTFRMIYEHNML